MKNWKIKLFFSSKMAEIGQKGEKLREKEEKEKVRNKKIFSVQTYFSVKIQNKKL